MKDYLRNWNFTRLLRLALGIIIIMQGIHTKEWLLVALGGFFSLLPLLNISSCGTTSCSTPIPRSYKEVRNTDKPE